MRSDIFRSSGVLVGLFLLSTGFIAYAIAPASIFPIFTRSFSIDNPTASISISAVFLTWAILQIPAGYVLDRYDNRMLVQVGTIVFLASSTSGLLAPSYPWFVFTRLLSGASIVFVFVGSINILSRILPDSRRAFGLSIFIASPPLGIVIAQTAGPLIAIPYGWRITVFAYIALSAVGFLVVLALLNNPVTATETVSFRQFATTLRNPAVLLVSTASLCTYTIWTFLVTWMPTYGTDILGLDLAAAGAAAALVPLAGIVARPGGGWISDQLHGRLRPVIVTSFLLTLPLLYGLSQTATPVAFAVLLAVTGAAVNLAVGLYLVYVNRLAENSTRGTSLSVLLTFSQIGNLVAPALGGWVIVHFSWFAGFGFAGALAIVGLATIVLIPMTTNG